MSLLMLERASLASRRLTVVFILDTNYVFYQRQLQQQPGSSNKKHKLWQSAVAP